MTKKIIAVLITAVMLMCMLLSISAFAEDADKTLRFNADGTFKILQMNDLQDRNLTNKKTIEFVSAALDSENPDLVVVVGDTLSDMFIGATKEKITTTIRNLMSPMIEREIPFLVTFGNHDHDRGNVMSMSEQMDFYKSLPYCYVTDNGCDPGTYYVPILSGTGDNYAANVYMMDTNNKSDTYGGYAGVTAAQVEWYKNASNSLKQANDGNVVPSILFQHIPTKEIYGFLKEVKWGDDTGDAVFSTNDNKWYVLDETNIISEEKTLGEAPCSEKSQNVTGQYEAWIEQGDIIGAFFGHDHVDNFVGVTPEGLTMGFNAGTGFCTYGSAGDRSVRCYVLNENDPFDFDTYSVTYNDVMNEDISFYVTDIFSPTLLTYLMRFINLLFGKIIALAV